jgi:cell wall-associated NlpC family hydrolase
MTRRLVAFTVCCLAALVLVVGTATPARPIRAIEPVKSPARFVPLKHPRSKPISIAARAVKLARKQLGVPYRWGGASPGGFDCSGLVMWVYGRFGVSLPHNAAALYGVGRPIARRALRPGDLLFFSGLGHVGMYIGRGRMIHAPQSGRTVEVQSLAARRGSFVGARRIVRY